jgi:Flp pilus assembly protein TadG
LVEFAVVCLAVYLLLAAMLTFGQWLYSAQGLQQAVDVAAREISRTPLPAALTSSGGTMTLQYALYGDASADPSLAPVRQQVFDDNLLVLTIDSSQSSTGAITYNGGHPIGDFPMVTQQLMPLMVNDQVNGQPLLRFPGAMFTSTSGTPSSPANITYSGYVVRIPVVSAPTASGGGQSIVNWLYPLEPILDSNGADSFAVNATTVSGLSGAVALRINYPYQSASMSGFVPPANPASPPGPPDNPVVPVLANNTSPSGSPPGVGSAVTSDFQYGAYAGANGLGQQAAWTTTVRPYRSVISPQAIYRREVFQ